MGVEDLWGGVVDGEEVLEVKDCVGLPTFVVWGSNTHFRFRWRVSGGWYGEDVGGVRRLLMGELCVGGGVKDFGLEDGV